MTTKATIDDYAHPHWCDLTRCRPGDGPQGMHASVGTMLPLGACHVTTALHLDDDRHPRTGELSDSTRVRFSIEDVESIGLFCEAWFEPDDVRLLAQVLVRYADLCDRARRFPERYTAETLRSEAAHS